MLHVLHQRKNPPAQGGRYPVFIYGTLRSGQANHHVLQEMIKLNHAVLLDRNVKVQQQCVVDIGGLPGLYNASVRYYPNISVVGEVYGVTPAGRNVLDLFEGHPHIYRRAQLVATWAEADNREARMAYTYFGPVPGAELIQRRLPLGHLIGDLRDQRKLVSDWTLRRAGPDFRTEVYDVGGVVSPELPELQEARGAMRWAVRADPFGDALEEMEEEEEEEDWEADEHE